MRTTTVFATATSSIHADLIIVGLKRLGIPTSGISVVYPSYHQPDAVLYWIDGSSRLALSTGEAVTASGALRFALEEDSASGRLPALVPNLRSLGLKDEQSLGFEADLRDDRVIVCVSAGDDSELALIVHILHHIGSEKIVIAETPLAERAHGKSEKPFPSLSAA
jgi:hypothetical protein